MRRNIIWFVLGGAVLLPLAVSAVHAEGHLFTATSTLPASLAEGEAMSDMHASLTGGSDADASRASSTKSVDGQLTAETYRHTIAGAVDSLKLIADNQDPATGADQSIRVVAQDLADSEEATTGTIEKIAFRSGLDAILFGNSQDIGTLQSAWTDLGKQVPALESARAEITDPSYQAALDTEIAAIEKARVLLARFITAHS